MHKTISQSDFTAEFHRAGRGKQFSHAALLALYDYVEEIDPDMELDVISMCCDWCEYDSAQEAAQAYGWKPDNDIAEDGNECDGEAIRFLNDSTQVIELKGGAVVIQNF